MVQGFTLTEIGIKMNQEKDLKMFQDVKILQQIADMALKKGTGLSLFMVSINQINIESNSNGKNENKSQDSIARSERARLMWQKRKLLKAKEEK